MMPATLAPPTTFSIRSLISPRRARAAEGQAPTYDASTLYSPYNTSSAALTTKKDRSIHWLPSSRRKQPTTPIMVFRRDSLHQITSPIPPLPMDQPRCYTASPSMGLQDHDTRTDLFPYLPDSPPARPQSNPSRRASATPDSSVAITMMETSRPRRPQYLRRTTSDPGLNKYEPNVDPEEPLPALPSRLSKDWSADIQKLIRETDLAFSSGDNRLSSIRLTSPDLRASEAAPSPLKSVARHSDESSAPKTGTPRTSRPKAARRPVPTRVSTKQRMKELPAPPKSAGHPASRSSSPRLASKQKKGRNPERSHGWPGMMNHSKWNLPDNVTDIFTGQRFKRIEADEMLTPARIEQLKRDREEASRLKAQSPPPRMSTDSGSTDRSPESARSFGSEGSRRSTSSTRSSDPPNSSVHGNEASSDDAAGTKTTATEASSSPTSLSSHPINESESLAQHYLSISAHCSDEAYGDAVPQDDVGRSATPPMIPARSSSRPLATLPLPPLPRKAASSSKSHNRSQSLNHPVGKKSNPSKRRMSHVGHQQPAENDQYVFLKSTPFTLTRPTFLHGPIAFSKAEIGCGAMTMDETLDWSAFQMAILGGAGELVQGQDEDAPDDRAVDDLGTWFDTFGFETCGELVPEQAPALSDGGRSSPHHRATSPASSISNSDTDLPILLSSEIDDQIGGGGECPDLSSLSGGGASLDAVRFMPSGGMKRGARRLHGEDLRPMVVGEHGGIDESVAGQVPMGCNMNEDLGDFLAWETQHMSGAAF